MKLTEERLHLTGMTCQLRVGSGKLAAPEKGLATKTEGAAAILTLPLFSSARGKARFLPLTHQRDRSWIVDREEGP